MKPAYTVTVYLRSPMSAFTERIVSIVSLMIVFWGIDEPKKAVILHTAKLHCPNCEPLGYEVDFTPVPDEIASNN